jgi:integrase
MLRIVQNNSNPRYPFYIDGYKVDGKRRRLFFTDQKAAKAGLKQLEIEIRAVGEDAAALSVEFRALALQAAALLAPYQKNLLDAARFFAPHLEAISRDRSVASVIEEYTKSKRNARFSARYLEDIEQRLGYFGAVFGRRFLGQISSSEIEGWLHSLGHAPLSLNNYRAVVSAFYSFSVKRGYIQSNPVSAIDTLRCPANAPEIFTPEGLRRVLELADADLVPAIALGAFAGLRTSELLELDWSEIDLGRGFVAIAAAKTKTARRRLVTIQPALKAWLSLYHRKEGRIYASGRRSYHYATERVKTAAGLAKWPQNGLRHSFASYHLAHFQNAAELMLQLGHSTTRLIFEHYREVVTPQAAAQYWRTLPASEPDNVVQIA